MAFRHGKDTVFTWNSVDLSAFTEESEFSEEVDSHEVTTYGQQSKAYIPGLRDRTFSCGGVYDDGASTPKTTFEAAIDANTTAALVRRAEGTGAGLPEESVSAFVTSYSESNPVGDKITWSAELQCTGAVTRSTQV